MRNTFVKRDLCFRVAGKRGLKLLFYSSVSSLSEVLPELECVVKVRLSIHIQLCLHFLVGRFAFSRFNFN